ncbi:MAG: excinuclease ABC subunit UvrC [Candidatus Omnitrophota bacterium]
MIDLSIIPDNPGCYIFSDESGKIIYIGKALNLKKRVRSYFQKKDPDPKTERLVQDIRSVEFIITNNEVEALILENTLIKKHHPKYNIELRDAKSYAYLRLTDDKCPRLVLARLKDRHLKGEFFGPFVSATARDYIRDTLNRTFRMCTCKKMPKRPCLRYFLGLCESPCTGQITEEAYLEKVQRIRMILKGKTTELLKQMTDDMKRASEQLNFEYALELRNQIDAIKWLQEKQNMERSKTYNEDIIHYVVHNHTVYLALFNVYKGTLENKRAFQFDEGEDVFDEFLIHYYSDNPVPAELIVPCDVGEAVVEFLKLKAGKQVQITIPQRGEKKQLLDLVLKNIEITFFGDTEKLNDLKRRLKMQETPEIIECFDISHISGFAMVASMVQFRNAMPDKANYRRYKIKTVEGIDDFMAIGEVVRRRYTRLKQENAELPHLIVIDGGIGQLNAATAEIKTLGLKIPVISLAKKFEEIYVPGADIPLVLSRKTKALQLLQRIRDEAHRFAITYNRLIRKKELLKNKKQKVKNNKTLNNKLKPE